MISVAAESGMAGRVVTVYYETDTLALTQAVCVGSGPAMRVTADRTDGSARWEGEFPQDGPEQSLPIEGVSFTDVDMGGVDLGFCVGSDP